ncbi:hypothetical protein [Streptomyces sp. NPDC057939]|uniref:hypothetical protein n=1 Tax=Streptomyces sp. NPDC057939 TaxID=3346284 RepID=UPI0036EEB7C0
MSRMLSVWDNNPDLPSIWPHDPYRIGRQGLSIVVAVSDSVRIHPAGIGKRITASVALAHDPHPEIIRS